MGDGLLVNDAFPAWSGAMEPFTTLAWLGGRLPTARLGVSAAVLPLRDVTWTAKQAATLDHLSEGKFVLAVAPGFWAKELEFPRRPTRRSGVRSARRATRAVPRSDRGTVAPIPAPPKATDLARRCRRHVPLAIAEDFRSRHNV
jgi:alkanesulfonate monooxygenase SsuD/methylene tetrahydromethanopterin reductase-like flavin-dependent oxidoreductase (luciferase family)